MLGRENVVDDTGGWNDSQYKHGLFASWNGHAECVRALIAAKATVDHATDGWTALMSASSNGHIECVRALIEAKATVDHANQNGPPWLHQLLELCGPSIGLGG